mgnify:CR=1 FL=1
MCSSDLVDSIGVGSSAYDALRHRAQRLNIDVLPVVASAKATSKDYPNLRSELWFHMRDWLSSGGVIPRDEKLLGELVAPTYTIDTKSRLVVASKDDIRETLNRSPDRADAANIAVYSATFASTGGANLRALRERLQARRL